jgi:hypothetical protein
MQLARVLLLAADVLPWTICRKYRAVVSFSIDVVHSIDMKPNNCVLCSSHHNLQVAAMILTAGHRIAFRAPYYPIDGPIEFVFNAVQTYLAINCHLVQNNGTSLRHWTMNGIANIRSFVPYFNNC